MHIFQNVKLFLLKRKKCINTWLCRVMLYKTVSLKFISDVLCDGDHTATTLFTEVQVYK